MDGKPRYDGVRDFLASRGIALPEGEDYDTVAGLVLKVLGRIPVTGDQAAVPLPPGAGDDEDAPVHRAVLTVDHMDGLRIDRLSLRVEEEPSDG